MSDQSATTSGDGTTRVPWIMAGVSWVVSLGLVVALVAGGGGSSSGGAASAENGFSSPEQVARAFADAIVDGEFDDAAAMFATASLVEGYSFSAHVEYLGAVLPQTFLPAPDFNDLNARMQVGLVGQGLTSVVRSLLMPERDPYSAHAGDAVADTAAWEATLSRAELATVNVSRVDVLSASGPDSSNAEINKWALGPWSGEDVRHAAILFDTDNGTAALGFTLIKLDGEWFVWNLASVPLGTPPNRVEFMPEADYASLIERGEEFVTR